MHIHFQWPTSTSYFCKNLKYCESYIHFVTGHLNLLLTEKFLLLALKDKLNETWSLTPSVQLFFASTLGSFYSFSLVNKSLGKALDGKRLDMYVWIKSLFSHWPFIARGISFAETAKCCNSWSKCCNSLSNHSCHSPFTD